METQGWSVESEVETDADSDVGRNGRRYSSPPRAEQAELPAQQRLEELEQARAELANLMSKKRRSAT